MPVVITDIPRPPEALVQAFQELDVATVHEAQGRKGLLASYMRPIYRPAKIIGTAVTCEVAPGDNWMIHVAVEQCQVEIFWWSLQRVPVRTDILAIY